MHAHDEIPKECRLEMVEALEEALDHWEESFSPLDEEGLRKYTLMRSGLNYLRAQLPAHQRRGGAGSQAGSPAS